jgi:hypothetical protein
MRASIDGGKTWFDTEGVRIEYPNFDGEGSRLAFNMTPEGQVIDVIGSDEEIVDSTSGTVREIAYFVTGGA